MTRTISVIIPYYPIHPGLYRMNLFWDHFFKSSKIHSQHFAMGMRKEIWKGAADIFYMIHLRPSMLSNAKCSYIEHENTPRACILKCTSGKTFFSCWRFQDVDEQNTCNQWHFFFFKGSDVPKWIFAFHQLGIHSNSPWVTSVSLLLRGTIPTSTGCWKVHCQKVAYKDS